MAKTFNNFLESEKIWPLVFDALPDLIAIIDNNHRIVKVNKAMANCLGISPHQARGLHCYEMVHHTSEPLNSCPHSKMLKSGLECTEEIQEDNLGGYFLTTVSPIQDFNGEIIGSVHIARNISQRRKIEHKLLKTVSEKELLIREINHRVKNNLILISSLLNIQSMSISDKKTRDVFLGNKDKIRSMALIHEKLYRRDNKKRLYFDEYIRSLAQEMVQNYNSPLLNVSLDFNIDIISLDVDIAIPVALICSEIITNSFKHAFTQKTGRITIELFKEDSKIVLIIADDGAGFPENFDFKKDGNMGFKLIRGLADQIGASIDVLRDNGTKFILKFKDKTF
ncbi:hypothetical protein JCM15415_02210 [Methanobacterium movens]